MAAAKSQKPKLRLNSSLKAGIGIAVFVLTAAVYFVVFHSELQGELDRAKTQEKTLIAALAEANTAKQVYQKDLAELAEREQRQRELSKILPQTTEYPAFLSAVQSVANVAGVSLAAWTPQEEVPEVFYARVPMRLKLNGRYHQVAKFFYQVGQLDRIINMENISLTQPELRGDDVIMSVEALATAFHLIEATEEGAADKKGRRKIK